MLYIIDTADVEAIRRINEFYPIAGVTTNPSIISREKTASASQSAGITGVSHRA